MMFFALKRHISTNIKNYFLSPSNILNNYKILKEFFQNFYLNTTAILNVIINKPQKRPETSGHRSLRKEPAHTEIIIKQIIKYFLMTALIYF